MKITLKRNDFDILMVEMRAGKNMLIATAHMDCFDVDIQDALSHAFTDGDGEVEVTMELVK